MSKMRIGIRGTTAMSILALLSVLFLSAGPAVFASPKPNDSEEVTKLLAEAKSEAYDLKNDAEDLKMFTRSKLTWQSHAGKINQIKESVNKAGELVSKLNDAKASASPWQKQAIEEVTPLLREVATNVSAAINHMNDHRDRLHTAPYTDYTAATADLAADLHALISDYLAYGEAKNKSEELGRRLEVPGA